MKLQYMFVFNQQLENCNAGCNQPNQYHVNFIFMSHPYRKLRAQTHRNISTNTSACTAVHPNKMDLSFVNPNYQGRKQSNHKHNLTAGGIPSSFYFDQKEKKQFIRNVIDGYFEMHSHQNYGNPQSYTKARKLQPQRLMRSLPRKQQQQIMPFAEKYALSGTGVVQNSARNNNRQHVHALRLKNMAKTMDVKFFSQRQSFQSPQKSLPIIDELNEDGNELRRPQSEQRSRYICATPTLKRRQSAGNNLCQSPKRQSSIGNRSSFSNESDFVVNDDDLAESVLFNKSTSAMSKSSITSQKSIIKHCKYYEIKYSKESVVKTFSNSGLFLLSRESKLKKLGAKTLQISGLTYPNQLLLTSHKPLTKQLYQLVPRLHATQQIQLLYINEPVYSQLFKNNSQFLRDIVIDLCKQLIQLQNKVIINKICMENVSRLGEKCVRVIDWSAVSIREKISNLDKISLVKITQPTLKQKKQQIKTVNQPQSPTLTRSLAPTETNTSPNASSQNQILKWICQPEYLAPQLIHGLMNNDKLDGENLWNCSYASDMWSIGCLIFQIISLIPLGAKDRYAIKGRNYNRRGLFYISQFSYAELQRKQRLFSTQASRIIKKECSNQFLSKIDGRVLDVMEKMLTFNRDRRIKPQEVISILSRLV